MTPFVLEPLGSLQMSATAKRLRRKVSRLNGPAGDSGVTSKKTVWPRTLDEIVSIVSNPRLFPAPVRAVGSGSSATRCGAAVNGTTIQMSKLTRILEVTRESIHVEAGLEITNVIERLADHGKELCGAYEASGRTIGGLVAGGSLVSGLLGEPADLSSSVMAVTLVTANGKVMEIDRKLPDLLAAVRQSHGLLGVIYSVRLRVRRERTYRPNTRKFDFAGVAAVVPQLSQARSSVTLNLLPFRDRAWVELRHTSELEKPADTLKGKLRDWASSKALPSVVNSVSRAVPLRKLRDPLIDGFSEATQVLLSSGLSQTKSGSVDQTGTFSTLKLGDTRYCSWAFPADKFAAVLTAFQAFSTRYYEDNDFRCDLPATAVRVARDDKSLLSPSFDGAVFALTVTCTVRDGWEDFLLDLGDFAQAKGGIPLFSHTRGLPNGMTLSTYGVRLMQFRNLRQRLDPQDRFLNQFFAQHVG